MPLLPDRTADTHFADIENAPWTPNSTEVNAVINNYPTIEVLFEDTIQQEPVGVKKFVASSISLANVTQLQAFAIGMYIDPTLNQYTPMLNHAEGAISVGWIGEIKPVSVLPIIGRIDDDTPALNKTITKWQIIDSQFGNNSDDVQEKSFSKNIAIGNWTGDHKDTLENPWFIAWLITCLNDSGGVVPMYAMGSLSFYKWTENITINEPV